MSPPVASGMKHPSPGGSASVGQVLASRRNPPAADFKIGTIVAVALHAILLTAVLFGPAWFEKPKPPLRFVEVTIMPTRIKGVEKPKPKPQRPAPQPPQEASPPEPSRLKEPEPEPEPTPIAVTEKPKPVQPKPAAPEPQETEPSPPQESSDPAPSSADNTEPPPPLPQPDEREGAADGSATGTSRFGSKLSVLDDPSFTYDYYLDQLLGRIENAWQRPTVGEAEAVITFRVLRSGDVEDLSIIESSGNRAFDLAALRAVRNASPLPPLPSSYRKPSLGVNLIVR